MIIPQDRKNMQSGYIMDVMAFARKMKTKEHVSFGIYVNEVLGYIKKSWKHADRMDLIFDSYKVMFIKRL